jgi:hypothetical protein
LSLLLLLLLLFLVTSGHGQGMRNMCLCWSQQSASFLAGRTCSWQQPSTKQQ